MTGIWLASHIVLWILMILVIITMLALARQIGLLNRRIPPAGAREGRPGPRVGDAAPPLDEVDLLGNRITISHDGSPTLLVFVSSGCKACEEIAPALRSLARSDGHSIQLVVASEDDPSVLSKWATKNRIPPGLPLIADFTKTAEFGSFPTPYAIAMDGRGIVRAKGVVNHLEHLESLINALGLDESAFREWRDESVAAAGSSRQGLKGSLLDGVTSGGTSDAE
jgi:methylamine dehydrogenase accessory protein MauD